MQYRVVISVIDLSVKCHNDEYFYSSFGEMRGERVGFTGVFFHFSGEV